MAAGFLMGGRGLVKDGREGRMGRVGREGAGED